MLARGKNPEPTLKNGGEAGFAGRRGEMAARREVTKEVRSDGGGKGRRSAG